jgi:hypothetical protein
MKSSIPNFSGPAISVIPLSGRLTAARVMAVATSSAAMGVFAVDLTGLPFVKGWSDLDASDRRGL